nr:tbc (tre 2:bub2:cdc16) domain family member [Hymenolepis microstoma]
METLLRIWDVFLLEGEKVIFRVAIALLMCQEDVLIRQVDTLAFWKSVKTTVSNMYDHETLMKTAFGGFKMIKRKEIRTRRDTYRQDLEQRRRQGFSVQTLNLKELITNPTDFGTSNGPRISCASALSDRSPSFIMCCIDNNEFSIKLGNTEEDVYYPICAKFEAPILCATWIKDQHILLGSAEGYLYSFDIGTREIAWELKMPSAVTAIAVGQCTNSANCVFVGMANGTLSLIMDIVGDTAPRDLFSQILGFTTVSSIVVIDEHVWCACGCSVEIFNVLTFDHVCKITISDNPLDNISCMAPCPYGIWLSLVGKTSLKLWSTTTFEPIAYCDIEKYAKSKAVDNSDEIESPDRITAILANDSHLFIGTASGTVFIYKTLKWKNGISPHSRNGRLSPNLKPTPIDNITPGPSVANLHEKDWKAKGSSELDEFNIDLKLKEESKGSNSQAPDNGSTVFNLSDQTQSITDSPPSTETKRRTSLTSSLNLLLTSRSQVTESPIRALLQIKNRQGISIISFSQRIKEDDAILKWEQTSKSGNQWTNKPMLELSSSNSVPILPAYLKSAVLRKMSSVDQVS